MSMLTETSTAANAAPAATLNASTSASATQAYQGGTVQNSAQHEPAASAATRGMPEQLSALASTQNNALSEASDGAQTNAHADAATDTPADAQAAWHAQVEHWREEMFADPELGGEHLAGTVARAQNALRRFDTEDRFIGTLLQESGYGNHPQVVRFFSRLADRLSEDSFSAGDAGSAMPPLEERMYAGWGK